MKKSFRAVAGALLVVTALLSGCAAPASRETEERICVVTTIYPIWDWVRCLGGEHVTVTLLQDSGVDLHSYQPTVEDMAAITGCDLFVCVGGVSDGWVTDVLNAAGGTQPRILRLLELLDREETPEEEDHEHEADEHVWLSLKNADRLCREIAAALAELDPAHQESYENNLVQYTGKLAALDEKYRTAVDGAGLRTLVFGDRFPFRYLAEDYGLTCFAAFSGCSAESEASFDTIVFLAEKVDELGLPAVLELEGSRHQIARTVARTAASAPCVLTLKDMQSALPEGTDYLTIMEENLTVLRQALD